MTDPGNPLHHGGSIAVLRPDWPAPASVRAACSTRSGGISTGPYAGLNLGRSSGDDAEAVHENRRRLADHLQLPGPYRWIRQVHGRDVVRWPVSVEAQAQAQTQTPVGLESASETPPEADASWTTEAGVVCVVQAADCLPVLLCDYAGTVVAAAHAGWRGLAAGVLEATVAALPVPATRLMAWLGPAIGPEAFEVGDEVRSAFVAQDPEAAACFRAAAPMGTKPGGSTAAEAAKHYADLFSLARLRLRAAGVTALYGGGISTHADPARFYSFRRDGVCGRMAALIWIESRQSNLASRADQSAAVADTASGRW